ncbi:MAG: hypothetical protein ACYTAO_24355 [Planctomycetota bacterium]
MPVRLMGLQISRVATVDEGDNPEARIVLFKRRPETTAADAAGEDEGMGKDITQELPDEVKAQFAAVEQAKVEAEEAKTRAGRGRQARRQEARPRRGRPRDQEAV